MLWLLMVGTPENRRIESARKRPRKGAPIMKNFPHASFPPETIALMTTAMEGALSRLPHPVNLAHVNSIAETILRSAQEGERDPVALERMAFLELMISPREDH